MTSMPAHIPPNQHAVVVLCPRRRFQATKKAAEHLLPFLRDVRSAPPPAQTSRWFLPHPRYAIASRSPRTAVRTQQRGGYTTSRQTGDWKLEEVEACRCDGPSRLQGGCQIEMCIGTHHLRPSFASRVRWGCTLVATTSARRPRLTFDGGVVFQPPSLSSFASRVRWGCTLVAATSARRLRLAFDGGLVC